MKERRQSERFRLSLPALIEYDDGTNLKWEKTQVENIGTGGALFKLQTNVEQGSALDLQLFDEDIKFAENLGIADDSMNPCHYLVNCEVLRTAALSETDDVSAVAVKFAGPLRILRDV